MPLSPMSEGVKPFAPQGLSQPGSGTPEGRRGCSGLSTAGWEKDPWSSVPREAFAGSCR